MAQVKKFRRHAAKRFKQVNTGRFANPGAATFEHHRLETFKMPLAEFSRRLGVDRHNYRNYIRGDRRTQDYIIARMLTNLNEMLSRLPDPRLITLEELTK